MLHGITRPASGEMQRDEDPDPLPYWTNEPCPFCGQRIQWDGDQLFCAPCQRTWADWGDVRLDRHEVKYAARRAYAERETAAERERLADTAAEWAARIVARHPALARPVAEALQLAEAGHVTGNETHCMVVNRERTTRYSLDYDAATGAWTCTCPAYKYRPYRAGRTAHCKHTMARAIAERANLIQD